MKTMLQGADNLLPESLYSKALPYIKNSKRILNLGCGILFAFENYVLGRSSAKFTSLDILVPKNTVPLNVETVLKSSVEDPLVFKDKFDSVVFFELIEHIDKTDELLKNCFNSLSKGGYLVFSFPNMSSLLARVELLLGYQPHILEVSNEFSNFGTGPFGKRNNPSGKTLHHIRGITTNAMKELVCYHGFTIERILGFDYRFKFLEIFPHLTAVNIFVCRKN